MKKKQTSIASSCSQLQLTKDNEGGGFLPEGHVRGQGWGSSGSGVDGGGGEGLSLALLCVYTCRPEHQSLEDVWQRDDALDAGALVYHHQPVHLVGDKQARTHTVNLHLQRKILMIKSNHKNYGKIISQSILATTNCRESIERASYFSFHYPVHNRLHGFHFVALHDSFKVLGTMLQRLRHRDVQVVVGLLSSQVLHRNNGQAPRKKRWDWPPQKSIYFLWSLISSPNTKVALTITSNLE